MESEARPGRFRRISRSPAIASCRAALTLTAGCRDSFDASMSSEKSPASPERELTDESLRVERQKADDVLGDTAGIEETADAVIERARARADDVVRRGRAKVDRAARAEGSAVPGDDVARERLIEDAVLREERAEADEVLRTERAEGAALLAQERGETDKDLSAERSRSDQAVATRDEFLGVVSHDLRSMLNGVVGFAALIVKAESDHPAPHAEQGASHVDALRVARRSAARPGSCCLRRRPFMATVLGRQMP